MALAEAAYPLLQQIAEGLAELAAERTAWLGSSLPAGATVAPCIYLAQRNPDVYPEPEEFRPERFVGVQPDPYSWLPFGGGVRRCVGAAFAMYEMKLVLGAILAAYDLKLAQEPARIRRRAITFWPEHGTRITVERRYPPATRTKSTIAHPSSIPVSS